MSVRVYLVDDHRLFLSGVKAELAEEFRIVGSAFDVDTAIAEIRGLDPEVVLVDVHMPDGGGIAVIEAVVETNPDVKFLALSVSDQAEDVIAMIRAGARGYVTKTIEPQNLPTQLGGSMEEMLFSHDDWLALSSTLLLGPFLPKKIRSSINSHHARKTS